MRQCAKCGKGSIMVGKRKLLRGHYNPTSKSRKYPNLQWARVSAKGGSLASPKRVEAGASGGEGVRKLICVQCMRTMRRGKTTK